MALGRFSKLIFGTGLDGTDNGDGSITVDFSGAPAADISIADAGGYFTGTDVEAALQELGSGGGGGGGSVATDTIWDAKGDLAGGTGADTAARLAVGSNDQVLVADSGQTTGLNWQSRIKSLAKNGSTALSGAVTLSEGSNVTLTQSGNDISIAASAGGSSFWTEVVKASDESVSSSTTLQNDDELFFTATSGKVFQFELILIYVSPVGGTAPDIKFGLGEDGTSARGMFGGVAILTTDNAFRLLNWTDQGASAPDGIGTATTNRVMHVFGSHVGNGGTFRLKWAQQTSGSNASTVKAGSTLRYRQIN